MSDRVVGWSVLGRSNSNVLVCARCLRDDKEFDDDLLGAADWAVKAALAAPPAAASEVLVEHAQAQHTCWRCGRPLYEAV